MNKTDLLICCDWLTDNNINSDLLRIIINSNIGCGTIGINRFGIDTCSTNDVYSHIDIHEYHNEDDYGSGDDSGYGDGYMNGNGDDDTYNGYGSGFDFDKE